MLRPERMSKVSITGSKSVMEQTIEALHEFRAVHLEEYDESWEYFRAGDPLETAEGSSEELVTVRSLINTLELSRNAYDPTTLPEDPTDRLESVRTAVTGFEDTRSDLRDELRTQRELIDQLEPFERLGIPLELLRGYATIEVATGLGSSEAVEESLAEESAVEAFDVFSAEDVIAVAAKIEDDDAELSLTEVLVDADFRPLDVPDIDGDPAKRRDDASQRVEDIKEELDEIDEEFEAIKAEHGAFLLAYEEALSIDVNKAEAPLRFATTQRAFITEGWVPTARVDDLRGSVQEAVGERVDVEELEAVPFRPPHEREGEVAADGGRREMHGEEPPTVMDNPDILKPFEIFPKVINRPRYHEIDPTLFVFLTFPLAFGYMIGDIGYGLLYMLIGYVLLRSTKSDGMRALAIILVWAGIFTFLFGYLYDDTFGVHMADLGLDLPLAGTLSKGLQLEAVAQLWVVVTVVFGIFHLLLAHILGFVNDLHHGVTHAFNENASWALAIVGLFAWVFSTQEAGSRPDALAGPSELSLGFTTWNVAETDFAATAIKPEFVVGAGSVLNENPIADLGFIGFSETVAVAGLAIFFVGVVSVYLGEGIIGIMEVPLNALGHALSYLRMMAVLLAKGGMALVVNLLVFGAYETPEGYLYFNLPTVDVAGYEQQFVGLVHTDPWLVTIPLAILIFILGHIIVLLLGLTAAGIQMTRLELVEFFGKFYGGGGKNFEPFGYERSNLQQNHE